MNFIYGFLPVAIIVIVIIYYAKEAAKYKSQEVDYKYY